MTFNMSKKNHISKKIKRKIKVYFYDYLYKPIRKSYLKIFHNKEYTRRANEIQKLIDQQREYIEYSTELSNYIKNLGEDDI